ncbi:unnamed protein product [Calypogeia fissa]
MEIMSFPVAGMVELLSYKAARIIIAAVCVLFLTNLPLRKWISKSWQHHGQEFPLPPGPWPLPILGNLTALGARPHESLQKLSKTYGPLMYLRLGSVPTVIVSSAEMAEEVLKTHDKVFASRPHLTNCEILGYGSQNFGFMPYGDQWRSARKMFTTKLVTTKRIEDSQRVRKDEILLMLKSVMEKSEGGKGNTAVPMFNEFFQMATNIMTRLMFSKRMFGSSDSEGFRASDLRESTVEVFRLFGVFNIGDYIPFLKPFDLQGYEKQMRAAHKKMDGILQGLLDARLKDLSQAHDDKINEADDIVTTLLTHPTDRTGKPMTADEIKGMMVDTLLAGTDSSAITLEWALSELLKNPSVMRKTLEELDRVVGRARLVDESDLPNLPYLQAVVKETLRLHPAGALMLPHESVADCKLGEYFVRAQTRVMVNVWAIGRDPAVWEHALEFRPSRFLPDQVDAEIDLHGQDFKLLPFGSGRRSCPGKNLALRMVEYTLAVMLQSCHWSLPTSTLKQDMSEKFGLGVTKAVKLEAVVTPRLTSLIHQSAQDGM